jgi:hypothetical protein
MIPLGVRRSWQIRRRYAVGALVFFCVLGLVPAGYGQTDRVSKLISQLRDRDPIARKSAVEELGEIKDPRAVSALLAALMERETAAIAGAYTFFIERGEPGSEDALIETLGKTGNENMAQKFLNCGNTKLQQAARSWATSRGYRIFGIPSGGHVEWGSAR